MKYWTYLLIGIAVSALLGYMRKPKAPKGQTVAFPALMAVIGGIAVVFFGGLTLWAYADGAGMLEISVFLLFVLLGVGLVMAYINCRIHYDEKGFTAKSLLGISRTYTYDDITWIKGTKDVKLYVGDRVVRIDELSVGKLEFLFYAEERYMRTHGGRRIPTEAPDGKKSFDLFNGNVENPGEMIAVFILIFGACLATMGYVVYDSRLLQAEDLSYSHIQVERYEVEGDDLWLYGEGEELPFETWGYVTSLEDADAFLRLCEEGASLTVGYISYPNADEPYHKLHYVEGESGVVYLTMEAAHREEMKNTKELLLMFGCVGLLWLLVVAVTVYVGRYPERFSPKIVHLFFKKGCIRIPDSSKKES